MPTVGEVAERLGQLITAEEQAEIEAAVNSGDAGRIDSTMTRLFQVAEDRAGIQPHYCKDCEHPCINSAMIPPEEWAKARCPEFIN
jgi:hypothetical protein